MQTTPCLHCLSDASCSLRLDKKGRPYTTCSVCGTRSFMHSRAALRGLLLLAPQLVQLWTQATRATEQLRALDAQVEPMVTKLKAAAGSGNGGF